MIARKAPLRRGRPPKARSERARSALIREADRLFSAIIRRRGVCRFCGTGPAARLDCAHVFEKSWASLAVRWDERNALPLCRDCHRWGHANKWEFLDRVERMLGADEYRALREKAHAPLESKVDVLAEVERLRRLLV